MKSYTFNELLPFGFEIKNLTQMNQRACSITSKPHRTNFYQIIRITSGKTIQKVDFSPIELREGQILFIGKDQVLSFDVESTYTGEIILFTDDFYIRNEYERRLIKQTELFNPFTKNIPIETHEYLDSIWELMKKVYSPEQDPYIPDLLHHLLSSFLIYSKKITSHSLNIHSSSCYSVTLEFSIAVEKNYKILRKVNDYVCSLGISPKALSKALKNTVGKSPKEYIDERILLEAKRLLVYSELNIKEISFELGFDEPTNFSKFFRKWVGISPIDFKKQHLS